MRTLRRTTLVALLALPSLASAQGGAAPPTAPPQVGPPIQPITTASAVTKEPIGTIVGVRELRDGRVLVNDGMRRRLLLMDSTLTEVTVVLDSLTSVANSYGTRPGALVPYHADSTLFVDPVSYAVLVIDPEGRVARVRSVWRVQDLAGITNPTGAMGLPGVDAKGRVVYRIPAQPAPPAVAPPPGIPYIPQPPDSAFIVAVDLETRRADTLAVLRIPKTEMRVRRTGEGILAIDQSINPLPSTDDWAILPDGTVAVVRGQDYRVEYLNPDGSWSSSEKLPFDWQRMTDEGKQRMVDSVRTAQLRTQQTGYVTSMINWVNRFRRNYPESFEVPAGYTPPPGFGRDWKLPAGVTLPQSYVYGCAPGEEPVAAAPPPQGEGGAVTRPLPPGGPGAAAGAPGGAMGTPSCIPGPVMISGGNVPPPPTMRPVSVLPPSELPDYRPPLATNGAVRADMDGNLWIRTNPMRPVQGGPVFDIVSREGQLVNRLQLPPGYTLVGFGKGKVVYLSMRDQTGIHLARVRLR